MVINFQIKRVSLILKLCSFRRTISTPAAFWYFVDTFCFKFSNVASFTEIGQHSLSYLSYSNHFLCDGKFWSWRIQRWIKRQNPPFKSWYDDVWNCRVGKENSSFCERFSSIWRSISGQPWQSKTAALNPNSTFDTPFDAQGSEVSSTPKVELCDNF